MEKNGRGEWCVKSVEDFCCLPTRGVGFGRILFLSSSIVMVDVADDFWRELFFLPFYLFAMANDVI